MKELTHTTTVEKLNEVAGLLPMAYEYPINDLNGKVITNFKGITTKFIQEKNKATKKNEYLKVFSKDYHVVQHSFVANTISTILNDAGLKGKVLLELRENGAQMNGYIFFDDRVIKDDAKGIKVGFKFTNSYDGKSSISFSTYGIRMVCMNQMVLRNLCTKEVITHMGDKDFTKHIKEAIDLMMSNDKQFQALVDSAISETFTWQQATKIWNRWLDIELGFNRTSAILSKIGVSIVQVKDEKDKKAKPVTTFVKEKDFTLSKWAMYNAVTDYLSHKEKQSIGGKDFLFKVSEDVLEAPVAYVR